MISDLIYNGDGFYYQIPAYSVLHSISIYFYFNTKSNGETALLTTVLLIYVCRTLSSFSAVMHPKYVTVVSTVVAASSEQQHHRTFGFPTPADILALFHLILMHYLISIAMFAYCTFATVRIVSWGDTNH